MVQNPNQQAAAVSTFLAPENNFDNLFTITLLLSLLQIGRVAGGCCQPQAPSERCVRVSPHTAQASEKASLVGIPATITLLHVTV